MLTRALGRVLFSRRRGSLLSDKHLGASPAMEVTLSRKRAESRTRGRKLHLTEAKARVGRARKTRADLEQELKACRREIAHARERLAEATMQQTATSEMLRIISNSPIQLVLDAVAENAACLCDANNAEIFRLEDNLLRLAASYGEIPVVIHAYQGVPVNRDTVTGRAACDRRTIHVHDLAAEEGEYPVGSSNAKREGHRTTLATPLLREGTPVGVILVRRREVRPFSDEQIALIETFADQAVIAIENVRLFEVEKQRTLALARANRDLAEREAKIRRLVDANIIGIFVWDFEGRILEANDEFLRMVNHDREDLASGRIRWADLTPPDWRDRNNARIEQQKSSGRVEPFEKEYTRKDGSRVPVLIGGATFEEGGNQGVAFVLDLTERKRAEEALRESEYKLRQITDTVPGLLWSNGPDGEPTHVSQRMLDYSGVRFEEFKDIGWEAFVHPADFPEAAQAFHHAIQTGTSYQAVMRLRRADGEFRWHHARCEPLRDRQGRILQWYGLSVDIDEGKKTEEQPRSAAQLQATLNVIPAYTWYAAPSGGLTFANKRTADYLGIPKDHPLRFGIDIGAQWDAHVPLLHPDDQEKSRKSWSTCLRTGEFAEESFRVLNAQGGYRWFRSRVEPLRASDGTLLQWVGVNVDIDELKCAEQALRESEYKLRQIIETVPSLLWSTDPAGEPTQLSQRLLDYSGMQFEGFLHGGWEAFIHPDDFPETARAFNHAIQTGTSYQAVNRLRRADGEFRWHHTRGEPLHDREGQIVQWYGLSVDIDERKKAEERLRRSESYLAEAQMELAHANRVATMGQLTASITHEVNQPITAAITYALAARRWLSAKPPNFHEVDDALSLIVKEGNRAGEVIGRIRALIKKAPARKDAIEINDAILEIIALTRTEAANNNV